MKMLVFETVTDLQSYLEARRKSRLSIGFVPTMGALHKGHVSLIEQSRKENDLSVCSIFVNPSQFNDKKDLEKYPRTPEADIGILKAAKCDVLFMPSVQEIYPEKQNNRWQQVDLGELANVMEGAKRPGHFAGVIQVVSRLFDIVQPDRAYFGQKDFQQQAIIREMAKQMHYPIEIVTCPILRETDGLAMSSRNVRLLPSERAVAPMISRTLFLVQQLFTKLSADELTMLVESEMLESELPDLDYFSVIDPLTLQPIRGARIPAGSVACIAVKLGQIRLIDNVVLE